MSAIDKQKAVFVVTQLNGMFCATTRPIDKGEGRIGLPGGKVDPGEGLFEAALREAKEEGWLIDAKPSSGSIIHSSESEKYKLFWVTFNERSHPIQLTDYQEKSRGIQPILVGREQIVASGYGNDFLKDYHATKRAS